DRLLKVVAHNKSPFKSKSAIAEPNRFAAILCSTLPPPLRISRNSMLPVEPPQHNSFELPIKASASSVMGVVRTILLEAISYTDNAGRVKLNTISGLVG